MKGKSWNRCTIKYYSLFSHFTNVVLIVPSAATLTGYVGSGTGVSFDLSAPSTLLIGFPPPGHHLSASRTSE